MSASSRWPPSARTAAKPEYLLSKPFRLKNEKDFAGIARSRKSFFGKLVGIKMRENKLPHSRFGVVVGLKVSKRSTDRNLIRRRIREILRKTMPSIKQGYDVMVLVNPTALGATFPELAEQIDKVLRKADLIVQ